LRYAGEPVVAPCADEHRDWPGARAPGSTARPRDPRIVCAADSASDDLRGRSEASLVGCLGCEEYTYQPLVTLSHTRSTDDNAPNQILWPHSLLKSALTHPQKFVTHIT